MFSNPLQKAFSTIFFFRVNTHFIERLYSGATGQVLYGWIGNTNSLNAYKTNKLGQGTFTIGRVNMGAAFVIASVAVCINVYPPQHNFEQSEDCSLFIVVANSAG